MINRISIILLFMLLVISSSAAKVVYGEYQFFREPKPVKIYIENQKICFEQDFGRIIFDYSNSTVIIVSDKIKSFCELKFEDFKQQIIEARRISFELMLNESANLKKDSLAKEYNFFPFSEEQTSTSAIKFNIEVKSGKKEVAGIKAYEIHLKTGKSIIETISFAQDTNSFGNIPFYATYEMLQMILPELSFNHQISDNYKLLMKKGLPLSITSGNFNWHIDNIVEEKIGDSVFSAPQSYTFSDIFSLLTFLMNDRYQTLIN